MEEEKKTKTSKQFFNFGNRTDRIENNLKLSDREYNYDKPHITQNPEDVLFPQEYINKNLNNDSRMSLETFKSLFKNKNKELNEYKEALNKKIEMLRNKILTSKKNNGSKKNSKKNIGDIFDLDNNNIHTIKGRNLDNKNISTEKIMLASTLKETNEINNINTDLLKKKQSKKNFEESYLFSLKKENKLELPFNNYINCDNDIYDDIEINYDLFLNTFYKNQNHQKNLYTLISLFNSNDLFKLFNINRSIRGGIIELLRNKIKENIIPKFITKYCNNSLFKKNSSNFTVVVKKYKKNKKAYIRMILCIKAKICENNAYIINKKHQISYQILFPEYLKSSTFNSYSFEIIPKSIPKKFWIYKEYTSYHYDDFEKAYYNDLLQFWPGDEILISIGLISELGILDFKNFHWLNPKIVPKLNKDNISNILTNSYLTNSEDTCEVEGLIHTWIGIEQFDFNSNVLTTLNELFGKNFEIKEIYYEDNGYYFFKVILEAKIIGECDGVNNNLGIKIKIVDKNKHICNEIKKNGLIYDENNELSVNINDIITFYISQNK